MNINKSLSNLFFVSDGKEEKQPEVKQEQNTKVISNVSKENIIIDATDTNLYDMILLQINKTYEGDNYDKLCNQLNILKEFIPDTDKLYKASLSSLLKSNVTKESIILDIQKRQNGTNQQIEKIQKDIKTKEIEIEQSNGSLQEKYNEIKTLNEKIDSLHKDCVKKEEEINNVKLKLESIKIKLNPTIAQINSFFKNEIDKLQ